MISDQDAHAPRTAIPAVSAPPRLPPPASAVPAASADAVPLEPTV
ncbi:dihydrolipoamide succinyltransferase, partial [Streptomyces sp. WAC 04229]